MNVDINRSQDAITLNIINLSSDIPLLIKYENLYDHFCRDMPAKPSIDAKKYRFFGRAIRELNRFQWNAVDGKIPQELDVKEIISMVRSLLDIPSKYKSSPRDIVYNTVALHDDQKKQDYFYDAYSFRENPNWKSGHEYSILSRIGPMISAFERNTLKLLYQTWDHHKKNEIIMDRLRRLYKIVLCLEFTPVLSVLDPARFVQEALDLDDDHPDFPQAVQRVQDIEILDTCHRIYASAREDVKDDEDDIHNDVIGIQKETRRITTAASKIIHKIFQHECVSNPDFLHKMNHVNENASAAASGGDVLEKYDVKYTSI